MIFLTLFYCDFVCAIVLSDESKRSMYDAGLYDPLEEEDQVRNRFFFFFFSYLIFLFFIIGLELKMDSKFRKKNCVFLNAGVL